MAIGRVSGSMLVSNLDRQGTDLQFTTNSQPLVYMNFAQFKMGVNTSVDLSETVTINGNLSTTNILLTDSNIGVKTGTLQVNNPINLGDVSNVKITGGSANYIITTDGSGNLMFANLQTLTALDGFDGNNIPLGSNAVGSFDNAITFTTSTTVTDAIASLNQLLGNITDASGTIIHVNSATINGVDIYSNISSTSANVETLQSNAASQASDINSLYSNAASQATYIDSLNANVTAANAVISTLQTQTYSNANVSSYLTVFDGNINAGNISISGNLYTDYISGNTGNIITFTSTGAIKLPMGDSGTRPIGAPGELRYNTDTSQVEYYNGVSWIGVTNTVTDQTITGDNVNNVFTLDQTATNISILVSINGTVQQPGVAYTVAGNQITFAEIPVDTDVIDIRFLGGISTLNNTLTDDLTISGNLTVNGSVSYSGFSFGNVIPSANVTYSLGSLTHQWKELWVSGNTIYIGNTPLTVSGGSLIVNGTPVGSGGGSIYGNSNVATYIPTDSTITTIQSNIGAYNNWANANVSGLSNQITGANASISALQANTGSYYAWANATFSTSSYSNANVASYLVANPQPGTYSDSNVASYLLSNPQVGTYGNANVSSYLPTYSGNIKVGNITSTQVGLGSTGPVYPISPSSGMMLVGNNTIISTGGIDTLRPNATVISNGGFLSSPTGLYTAKYSGTYPTAIEMNSASGQISFDVALLSSTANVSSALTTAMYVTNSSVVAAKTLYLVNGIQPSAATANVNLFTITQGQVNSANVIMGNVTANIYMAGNVSLTSGTLTTAGNVFVPSIFTTGPATVAGQLSVGSLTTQGTITASNQIQGGDFFTQGNLQANGTAGIKLPNRSAFRVYGTSGTPIPAGANVNSTYGTTIDYNLSSNYNNTTGVFTAPVAGLYHCYATIRVGTNNGMNQVAILKNNTTTGANVIAFWENDTNTGTTVHNSLTGYAKCVVGDIITLRVITGNIEFDTNDSWGVTYTG